MTLENLISAACLFIATACTPAVLQLDVQNPTDQDRVTETVEIPFDSISERLQLEEGSSFLIQDASGEEVAWQLTSDRTVIFPITLKGGETRQFTLVKGHPATADTICFGQVYPDRIDDLAWENDHIAFRAYGPALQQRGDKAFGYDIFAKRGSVTPVLPEMYRKETDKPLKKKIKELRQTNPAEAERLQKNKSYHIDHGHGMDCYAVGATLGAGAAALVENGELVYPWCWKEVEFLDNGPLRFKVKMTFTPMEAYGRTDVVETRILTLDAGARLNKTEISFANVDESHPMVSGIVMHDLTEHLRTEPEAGWISYQDPTTGKDNGEIYIGHAYAQALEKAEVQYFDEEESKVRKNATGHVLAESVYDPAKGYTYWWGYGWNREDFKSFEEWNAYLATFAAQLRHPLVITLH